MPVLAKRTLQSPTHCVPNCKERPTSPQGPVPPVTSKSNPILSKTDRAPCEKWPLSLNLFQNIYFLPFRDLLISPLNWSVLGLSSFGLVLILPLSLNNSSFSLTFVLKTTAVISPLCTGFATQNWCLPQFWPLLFHQILYCQLCTPFPLQRHLPWPQKKARRRHMNPKHLFLIQNVFNRWMQSTKY